MSRMAIRCLALSMLVVLTLIFTSIGGGVARAEEVEDETVLLPIVGNRLCNGRVAPTLFGAQMYGDTGRSSPYFIDLLESRATWVRVPVKWLKVEPVHADPPIYDWQAADTALAAVGDGCLNVIATHTAAPRWAADVSNGPVHPEYVDDLANYLGALVERYDGDGDQDAPGSPVVRYWQIYNEPDAIASWTGWAGAPEQYAAMLQTVYHAIKAASEEAVVLFGGLGYDFFDDPVMPFDPYFLEKVVTAGGDQFDMMTFHSFPLAGPNWSDQGPGLLQKTNDVRRKLDDLGLDKPIVITETGHLALSDPPLENSELQLRYVPQLYAHAIAADVEVLVWFPLYDLNNYPSYMGLLAASDPPRRRPAYAAYQFAAQELGTAEYTRSLSPTETGAADMEAYMLYDPVRGQSIVVAWLNPVHTSASRPLSLVSDQATVRDVFGNATIVTDGQDGVVDGRVTVDIDGRPVYVEME